MAHEIISIKKAAETKVTVAFLDTKLLLSFDIVYRFQLRSGDILTDAVYEELLAESNKHRVYESALRFIERRMHSRFELYRKLIKKNYEKQLVNETLQKLTGESLLNDKIFAEKYSADAYYHKRFGKNKIRLMLRQRGIDSKIADAAIDLIHEDESDEEPPLLIAAKKKLKQLQSRNTPEQESSKKLISYLLQRGYTFYEIKEVMKILNSAAVDENMFEE